MPGSDGMDGLHQNDQMTKMSKGPRLQSNKAHRDFRAFLGTELLRCVVCVSAS